MVDAMLPSAARAKFSGAHARLFICGGFGGHVTYDGKGGPMFKAGAPMDRMFLLRNDHEFNGMGALSIEQGHLKITTGALFGSTRILPATASTDTTVEFTFDGLANTDALLVKGAIYSINVAPDSTLISGDIAPSLMKWEKGDVTGRPPMLPYTAYHENVTVHPAIIDRFGIDKILGAETGWPKGGGGANFAVGTTGAAFTSQQNLGVLSVFCSLK